MYQFIDVGYYHPSTANWSYKIFMVIHNGKADIYSSTFGGDSRAIDQLKAKGEDVKVLYQPYTAKYNWKDVKNMADIETLGNGATI
jgi:hypothetical protein